MTKQPKSEPISEPITKNSTAPAVYAQRRAQAEQLLKRLSKALVQYDKATRAEPGNWGRVGDMSACNEYLLDALGRLGALTDQEVQDQR